MKIGIITLPLHTNFGGILQVYALQTVLKRMGHEGTVIYAKPRWKTKWYKMPLVIAKRLIKKHILGYRNTLVFLEAKVNRELPIVSQYTEKFIERHISRRILDSYEEIRPTDYDAFVVGSDQVWRPIYFHPIENAFLRFAKGWNVRRVAYAASFGVEQWEYDNVQTEKCKQLVNLFDVVSVREYSGVDLCRNHLGVKAEWVLDPTMLLGREDYIHLFENSKTPKSVGNLLCYILDETEMKQEVIEKVAKEKGLVPFRVNSRVENITAPVSERIQPPVEQWLRGFYDAEFIVTDSFHACVFSIIFHKPFVVVANINRGMGRFQSLLSLFGLNERLVVKEPQSLDIDKLPDINWQEVDKIIDSKKLDGIRILKGINE